MRASILFAVFAWIIPARAWDGAQLVKVARAAVRAEVLHKKPPVFDDNERALPVFVTIEKRGRVIGCRGAMQARETTLSREVMRAARGAASHDPRYAPLSPQDLKSFLVTVTIVQSQTPLPLEQIDSLLPEDGLVLQSGGRWGIVLPWEGKSPQVRLGWAYRKAGVSRGASCRLFRLKAERFRG